MLRFTPILPAALVWCSICTACADTPDTDTNSLPCAPYQYSCDIADRACAEGVLELTACIRGDRTVELPKINQMTGDEFGDSLRLEARDRGMGPSAWDEVLRELGLIATGQSSLDASIAEAVQSVAAFYDSETKEITIVTDSRAMQADPRERMYVLSHELTHALQDHAYDLEKLHEQTSDSTDSNMALGMLVEGEATVTSTRALLRLLRRTPESFDFAGYFDQIDAALADEVQSSKSPLAASLQIMPYSVGGRYIEQVWEQRDRSGVEALFESAPPTAADWIAGDSTQPGRSLSEPLDCAPPLAPRGYTLYAMDQLGAAGIVAMLGAHDEVDLALAGELANDAIALYVQEGGDPAAGAPVVGIWRLRFHARGHGADRFRGVLEAAGFDVRTAGAELIVRVSSPEAASVLSGAALDACPTLEELEPLHTTPAMPEATLKLPRHPAR